ncbi:Alpha/Beta hydrolase protein [Pyrenochaeta sp. MPI-SDFR-AT-0127]|nr:Alpha/Beta hydrolase protein [Pyrenochaeta sp. MPI-SDFR-AT-0127]
MALQYVKAKSSILPRLFSPTVDAIFSNIPFWQRWRTLLLQPINLLAALITAPTWLFNNRYSVIYVDTRSGSKRCFVYQPPRKSKDELRPLHIDIHGGGFIGGISEQSARWCSRLSDLTGTVVISCTYRITPRYVYPAAHDDIDDIVAYLISNARDFSADPELLTIGGSSVGGSLALSASQLLHQRQQHVPKAWVGFYPLVDARSRPQEKPIPPKFPSWDPLKFLLPMYDVYGGTNRTLHLEDPRLHLTLAAKENLPKDLLFVVAGIDILRSEQLTMVDRLQKEVKDEGDREMNVEVMLMEDCSHGFLELPKSILEKERLEVFARSIEFIKVVHRKHGFDLERE